ncbi:hypothetical protein SAMN02927900_02481 [Rhizobium mongolense subsp. loessense]|uniref:Uncharacterized protein n=1 Tax=Rhizobium mongolense subsp. loessense TaxID=158890 RepID=A0A1G4RCT8_9HYPH|nr:hypothetical protein SAMN02927900_02481 [Rhizobium mongolense subsp. loessense]
MGVMSELGSVQDFSKPLTSRILILDIAGLYRRILSLVSLPAKATISFRFFLEREKAGLKEIKLGVRGALLLGFLCSSRRLCRQATPLVWGSVALWFLVQGAAFLAE